jgi:site-specific recombinase XerD
MSTFTETNMSRLHRVNDKNRLVRRYKIIPYSELVEILKEDGQAFFENSRKQPLKRQTVWKAAKRVSEMVGKKVDVKPALLRLESGESMEGYSFSLVNQPPQKKKGKRA